MPAQIYRETWLSRKTGPANSPSLFRYSEMRNTKKIPKENKPIMKRLAPSLIFTFLTVALAHAETVSPLLSRGYTVMPEPQVVRLGASDFVFGGDWGVEVQGVNAND